MPGTRLDLVDPVYGAQVERVRGQPIEGIGGHAQHLPRANLRGRVIDQRDLGGFLIDFDYFSAHLARSPTSWQMETINISFHGVATHCFAERGIGTSGHRDTGTSGHRDTGTSGHRDICFKTRIAKNDFQIARWPDHPMIRSPLTL